MSNISEFSLTRIVSGIKKKDFTSEEVTRSFINNSKKSKKLNTYITECFDQAIQSAKNFNKKTLWKEDYFNAVGFPKVFYITYHGYAKYFTNWALSRYQNLKKGNKTNRILGL